MTRILAIDPGPIESGWVRYNPDDPGYIIEFGIMENRELKHMVRGASRHAFPYVLAIEMIAGYGLKVGSEVFETCLWAGRFEEAFNPDEDSLRCYRKDICEYLCDNRNAGDPWVKKALIDRFGPPGTKGSPGPTYGIKSHVWAALAVAVYAADQLTKANHPT
jgi:hypothetical protein